MQTKRENEHFTLYYLEQEINTVEQRIIIIIDISVSMRSP